MLRTLIRRTPIRQMARCFLSTDRYFDKVLIANRGEIAERVIRTCRRLGIRTTAIFSTADSHSRFVEMADEAFCVGPPNDSYLNVPKILDVIKTTGAQAVHPGYGFLSENSRFCNEIQKAGAVFLGPPVSAIQKLGDKIESKKIATEADVTIIPGYDGVVETLEQALELCNSTVPYPVLLKAAAGGGGKGMRVCYNDEQIREAWVVAKAESLKFFSDDRLLVEKFIENPHHIEFQVMAAPNADGETEVAVFPERECSIQRRNQKIIEETPSCLLKEETRLAMADQVRRLCKRVGYESAGTVEWLVDENQNFYFLEMNTRLQVEHPITESITGKDLVEAMLHVGAGRGLPDDLREFAKPGTVVPYRGHAIEARIYAEDPLRGFLPSTGPLTQYIEPESITEFPQDPPYVRCDSGVVHGHIVSPFYDPMLSKLVYYGEDRAGAISGMLKALDQYVIEGVRHNARLVQSVLRQPAFQEGHTPTSFLPTHYPDGFHGVELTSSELEEFAAAGAVIGRIRQEVLQHSPLSGGAQPAYDKDTVIVRLGGQFGSAHRVKLEHDNNFVATVELLDENGEASGSPRTIAFENDAEYDPHRYQVDLTIDGSSRTVQVLKEELSGEIRMQMHGFDTEVLLQSPREYELSRKFLKAPVKANTENMVLSPMPGLLISYAVEPGDEVEEGQELCVVESMKMQNMIRSPRKGVIALCKCKVGASLMVDEVILTFEKDQVEGAEAA